MFMVETGAGAQVHELREALRARGLGLQVLAHLGAVT